MQLTPSEVADGLERNRRASSRWGWGSGLVLLVGAGILGLGGLLWLSADMRENSPSGTTWDGQSTVKCGGNHRVTANGVTAKAPLIASGNCHVTLVNVDITAPIAITASGNAHVTMTGGSVTGSSNALQASGDADVSFVGTKVTGNVSKSGNAHVAGI